MNLEERRKFPRIEANNLNLDITVKKGDIQSISHSECQVVNISFAGLKIETQYPIKSEHVYLAVIDSCRNTLEIKGRVVYCEEISPKMFHTGISFIGSDEEKGKFILQLKIPFRYSKVNLAMDDERLYA